MTKAIEKIRAKLFSRFSPLGLKIDPSSEKAIAPYGPESVGGIEYSARDGASVIRVMILHVRKDEFLVVTSPLDVTLPVKVERASFWNLDSAVRNLVRRSFGARERKLEGKPN